MADESDEVVDVEDEEEVAPVRTPHGVSTHSNPFEMPPQMSEPTVPKVKRSTISPQQLTVLTQAFGQSPASLAPSRHMPQEAPQHLLRTHHD